MSSGRPGESLWWFPRLYNGDPGIDPYTRVVSDVYQDLFREGSFAGKGIYDIDALTAAVADHERYEDEVLYPEALEVERRLG